jgi:hypothetical protein
MKRLLLLLSLLIFTVYSENSQARTFFIDGNITSVKHSMNTAAYVKDRQLCLASVNIDDLDENCYSSGIHGYSTAELHYNGHHAVFNRQIGNQNRYTQTIYSHFNNDYLASWESPVSSFATVMRTLAIYTDARSDTLELIYYRLSEPNNLYSRRFSVSESKQSLIQVSDNLISSDFSRTNNTPIYYKTSFYFHPNHLDEAYLLWQDAYGYLKYWASSINTTENTWEWSTDSIQTLHHLPSSQWTYKRNGDEDYIAYLKAELTPSGNEYKNSILFQNRYHTATPFGPPELVKSWTSSSFPEGSLELFQSADSGSYRPGIMLQQPSSADAQLTRFDRVKYTPWSSGWEKTVIGWRSLGIVNATQNAISDRNSNQYMIARDVDNSFVLTDELWKPAIQCSANLKSRAVMLVTGWSGTERPNDTNLRLSTDPQLSTLKPNLEADGYVEGCNLFYAVEQHPWANQRENALKIHEQMCRASDELADRVTAGDLKWDGKFDIVSLSYGGLRAREYLETYYGTHACPIRGNNIHVENLVTLGTPHDGELPIPPTLGGFVITATAGWQQLQTFGSGSLEPLPALIEMLPVVRKNQNGRNSQPVDVCYHFVSGDITNYTPPTTISDFLWEIVSTMFDGPHDIAVHRPSALGEKMRSRYPAQYPNVTEYRNEDLHGNILFGLFDSYTNNPNTYANIISPALSSDCQGNSLVDFDKVDLEKNAKHQKLIVPQDIVTRRNYVLSEERVYRTSAMHEDPITTTQYVQGEPTKFAFTILAEETSLIRLEALAKVIDSSNQIVVDRQDILDSDAFELVENENAVILTVDTKSMSPELLSQLGGMDGVWHAVYDNEGPPFPHIDLYQERKYRSTVAYLGDSGTTIVTSPETVGVNEELNVNLQLNLVSDGYTGTLKITDLSGEIIVSIPMSEQATNQWNASWTVPVEYKGAMLFMDFDIHGVTDFGVQMPVRSVYKVPFYVMSVEQQKK